MKTDKIAVTLNYFRTEKIRDKFLLTTDHGSWVLLDNESYNKLLKNDFEDFKVLEEKGIIVTSANLNNIIEDYRKRFHYLFKGVSLHILIPTLRCNHRCVYCHSSAEMENKKGVDMSRETAEKILQFIFQSPSKYITIEFQGGDALLNLEIFKFIVAKAKEINDNLAKSNPEKKKEIKFDLVTNLTLMTDELMEWILKEEVNVCTSLDGPKFVHDKNRKYIYGSSYDAVNKWLWEFKKKGKSVGALMVTTRHSLPYYKEIIDEYIKQGIPMIQLKYMNLLGFAQNNTEIAYSVDEFLDFWKKSVDYIIELNKQGKHFQERITKIILQKLFTKFDPCHLDFRNPCGIANGQLAYNFNGDIFSCDEGRCYELFKLGNVYDNSYEKVLSSKKTQELISASLLCNYLCDNCAFYPYCGTCIVTNYAEHGNLFPKINSSKCKLRREQFRFIFEKILFDEEARKILMRWV